MSDMISVAAGFQSSVNIAYDINDEKKLKNYIPTKSALQLLETILLSTGKDSTDRARILIGAYGKGKSHIVLMILSILMKKDLSLFEKLIPMMKREKPELYQLVSNYYASSDRILPVVINGSSNSLTQAFLLALQRTLNENELMDIMPETNYQAAINTIVRWKEEFEVTFNQFVQKIDTSPDEFIKRLENYDPSAYELFEKMYPSLTAGSSFNPFIGFDVVDLYEEVIKALKTKGYTGIYVVYDEFSKYLENHITDATKSDTKVLQDFAEKCGRSGKTQLHLMLISHKEITSYIDRASKTMIDGWRGVSERFHHIYLNDNFSQTYEIIAAAIEKDSKLWKKFCSDNSTHFEYMKTIYAKHPIFADTNDDRIEGIISDCYPLHPVSTFILPRLSERVAQNERTLFTFISSSSDNTLSSFLKKNNMNEFHLVTPELIYDYFEPLLKQEVYSGNLHKYYILTSSILRKIEPDSLEAKIVKTIALIYILEQFEKLRPTVDELNGIYGEYGADAVNDAVKRLVEEKYVIYQKKSNNYLRLKESSGIDIKNQIADMVLKRASKLDVKTVINESNFDHYVYPSRYNDEKEMTRFFEFRFIDSEEVELDTNWDIKRENVKADGIVFAVIPNSNKDITRIKQILSCTKGAEDCVFVVPNRYYDIRQIAAEFDALQMLMQTTGDDNVLFEDYEVVYEDLRDVLRAFIEMYSRPEKRDSTYYYFGEKKKILRKSDLTNLLSLICNKIYGLTPVINNEMINKEEPTIVATNSRNRLLAGILRTELEPNLGLSGSGQEVSIMRSTLLNNGIITEQNGVVKLDIRPKDKLLAGVLEVIEDFIISARQKSNISFADLYEKLTSPKYHIGLRKGLIPIYLSVVLHKYKKEVVIFDRYGQVTLNVDAIEQINAEPSMFTLSYIDWNQEKEEYLSTLEEVFGNYIVGDSTSTSYEHLMIGMKRWYMELPKYAKNVRMIDGKKIKKTDRLFLQEMRKNTGSYDLLFNDIPRIYGVGSVNKDLAENVKCSKDFFDRVLNGLKSEINQLLRKMFCVLDVANCEKMSLTSIIRDWCEKIDPLSFEQLFADGTERCLALFKNITNDEDLFIEKVAKMATDLRLEDWDESVLFMFEKNMEQYRNTAENFRHNESDEMELISKSVEDYELIFKDENGTAITKRFAKVEESKKGKLLYNSIKFQLESMGQAISEQEKRQILMEVLKEMC